MGIAIYWRDYMAHGSGWFGYLGGTSEKPKISWNLLHRVLEYGKPYRWKILSMLVLILISTGLTLISPLIMRTLIDQTIPQKDIRQLVGLSLALLIIPILGGAVNVVQRRLNSQVGEGVIFDLRVALYSHLQRMSLRFFTNTRVGELMSRLNNDVIGAQNAVSNTLVNIITNIIQATAILLVMLRLEWRLTLISVAILPFFIFSARLMGGRLRDIARRAMDLNAQMNAMVGETLNIAGALLVKLFGRTDVEIQRFEDRAAQVKVIGVNRAVLGSSFMVIVGLVGAVGTALVFGIGGYMVIQGAFTIGTIVAFGAYLSSLYGALSGLTNAPVEFATSVVSFERVFEVLDLPLDIQEKPGAIQLDSIAGEIEFREVTFRYQVVEANLLSEVTRYGQIDRVKTVLSGESKPVGGDQRPDSDAHSRPAFGADEIVRPLSSSTQAREVALKEISFKVATGQLAALVGPSGAGKTTLTYLIPRLYDPNEGALLIDGHDLRDVTLESLSAQIGMVTQETYLFHDTIRTNLLYARLDASQEDLESACRAANIHEFIMGLPEGYDTIVGERGYRLSGGEKQRIALARVILKNPRILVLDEATSHLDSESESLIQDALKRVMAGRTSIVIAHRLSTILASDLILVMDRGEIVERGTHQELLGMGGLYAHLFQTQFRQGKPIE
jgi:ATP-binding cassette subfamily B protein